MVKRFINKILACIKNVFSIRKPSDDLNKDTNYIISKSAAELMKKKYLCLKNTTDPEIFSQCYRDIQFLAKKIDSNEKALIKVSDNILYSLEKMKFEQNGIDEDTTIYSVTFGGRKNFYYYLGNGTSYKEGQYVLVPVGDSMEEKIAKVHSKCSHADMAMPLNSHMLKKIITHAI